MCRAGEAAAPFVATAADGVATTSSVSFAAYRRALSLAAAPLEAASIGFAFLDAAAWCCTLLHPLLTHHQPVPAAEFAVSRLCGL